MCSLWPSSSNCCGSWNAIYESVQSPVQAVVSSWELEIKQVVCLVSLVKQVVCLALKCQMHRNLSSENIWAWPVRTASNLSQNLHNCMDKYMQWGINKHIRILFAELSGKQAYAFRGVAMPVHFYRILHWLTHVEPWQACAAAWLDVLFGSRQKLEYLWEGAVFALKKKNEYSREGVYMCMRMGIHLYMHMCICVIECIPPLLLMMPQRDRSLSWLARPIRIMFLMS